GPPDFLAGGRVVSDDEFVAAADQLRTGAGFHEDRRRPAHADLPARAPGFLPGLLIERRNERVFAVELLVANQDQQVIVKHGRSPDAHPHRADGAERLFPDQLAVEVITVDAFRTEVGPYVFPVGHWRRRGVIPALVAVIVNDPFIRGLLPEDFARVAVEAERLESVELVDAIPIRMPELFTGVKVRRRLVRVRRGASLDVGGQENFLVPDDRLRKPAAWKRRLPQDVLRLAPFGRQVFVVRDALRVRATPLGPVGAWSGGGFEIGDNKIHK